MKKTILAIFLAVSLNAYAAPGDAYRQSVHCATMECTTMRYMVNDEPGDAYKTALCKYGKGDEDWDKENQEWLDSDSDEPYPENLQEVDGDGYFHSVDAATDPNVLAVNDEVGSAYEGSVEAVFGDDDYDDYGDYDPRPN